MPHVQGVAVAEHDRLSCHLGLLRTLRIGGVEQAAVVVESGTAVDHLMVPVAVDVGHAQRMEALPGVLAVLRIVALASVRAVVERVLHRDVAAVGGPALLDALAVEVISDDHRACVDPAAEDR